MRRGEVSQGRGTATTTATGTASPEYTYCPLPGWASSARRKRFGFFCVKHVIPDPNSRPMSTMSFIGLLGLVLRGKFNTICHALQL